MATASTRSLLRVYWLVLVPALILVAAGMLAIYATELKVRPETAHAPTEQASGARTPVHTIRQAIYFVASLAAMLVAIAVPYQRICRYAYLLFVVMLGMLFLLAAVRKLHLPMPESIVPVVRGSARWIRLGAFQIQPSEFMKVAFILALAKYLRFRENYRTWLGLMPPFLLTLLPMALILMQPDLGTVLLMLPVLFAMLFMAGARLYHLLLILFLSLLAAPLAWHKMELYQRDRILVLVGQLAPSKEALLPEDAGDDKTTGTRPADKAIELEWSERVALAMLLPTFREEQIREKNRAIEQHHIRDPNLLPDPPEIATRSLLFFPGRFRTDPNEDLAVRKWIAGKLADLHTDEGYQLLHSKVALGSGGLTGRGLWKGTYVRYEFLPDRHNDFIYAILGHQWGLFGCLAVLLCYMLIIIGGIEVATATDDPFGRLLAVGVVSLIGAQVLVNVGMTIGLMPITGMTLPFVSFGGSSLITNFIAVGLLINVSQRRPLVLSRRAFEFDDPPEEQPASLERWLQSRR